MKAQLVILIIAAGLGFEGFGAETKQSKTKAAPSLGDQAAGLLELNVLDKRKPVPLSPMMALHQKEDMRKHLEVVQAIVEGLAAEDFKAVELAAKKIGFNEKEAQKCSDMGAGAPGFTEMAIAFHKTADTIVEAARLKDKKATLRALNKTLQTCTSCHSTYRQEVVAGTEEMHPHHHHHPMNKP